MLHKPSYLATRTECSLKADKIPGTLNWDLLQVRQRCVRLIMLIILGTGVAGGIMEQALSVIWFAILHPVFRPEAGLSYQEFKVLQHCFEGLRTDSTAR